MGTVEINLTDNGDGTFSAAIDGVVLRNVQGLQQRFASEQQALLAANAAYAESEANRLKMLGGANTQAKEKAASLEKLSAMYKQQADQRAQRPVILKEGVAALTRLFEVAQGDSGQCRYVAKFLLGCYNGKRFPFDLTDFRCLDTALFNDCMAVLQMDVQPEKEVHEYFPDGGRKFEQLVADWSLVDVSKLTSAARDAGGVDLSGKQ
jgi:hypothetical protein